MGRRWDDILSVNMERQGAILPDKLTEAILRKTGAEREGYEPVLPIYRARYWGMTRKWGDTFIVDVVGCNEDCAHCYVPIPFLRADLGSPEFQKKLFELPKTLRNFPQKVDLVFEYTLRLMTDKLGDYRWGAIELSSGEPTIYPRAVRRLGELCRPHGIVLGINTDGYLIATRPNYLKQFDGLQDTMGFLVSIKGTTPEDFEKFSGVRGEYYLTPYVAAQKIVQAGFEQPFLGVTVDTIANPGSVPEDVDRLMMMIDQYGLDRKKIIWDIIKEQSRGNFFPTIEKMIRRGYYKREGEAIIRNTVRDEVTEYLVKNYGVDRKSIK